MPHTLVKTALRVLGRCIDHRPPAPEDYKTLREAALPSEEGLEYDQLASSIVQRELKKCKSLRLAKF